MRLKHLLVSCSIWASLSSISWGSQVFRIDPAWSTVEFYVGNFKIHSVDGRFKTYSGTISFDDADITRSAVSVTIQAASVDTGIKKRDEHLRTADFFDVAKTPDITFTSEHITKADKGYVMTGPLTIKGHTQQVELPFSFTVQKSDQGTPILRGEAHGSINRHDFGLNYGSNFSISKQVHILIHIQATP